MVDTVEQAIYRLRAEGQEQVDRLKASVDGLVVSEEKLDGTTRTSSQALQNRLARMDPLIRAQQQYQKELESAQRYIQSGVGSQAQQNAQIELATQRYNAQVTAIRAVEKATGAHVTASGLARHELINLSRQVQDVGVSLASGQSPLMVLAQQGTQIADVFASSTGSVRGFFSQAAGWAGTFLKSTGGIATAVLAIGGAAIYAASQFARASTTIEQALEEQNRLLKEGKALLDQRTSLEARAQLQSKEQTQFETLRNQLDLQVKLNQAMEEAANISRRRATRPTEVPGEMGVAPTGFAALDSPGLDKMTAAFQALKDAQAAGLPGLKQYNAELAKIGLAHPELALVVQDMIKAGEEGLKLEFAAQRAKAMSDALAGVATNAQMAAVGLGSVAQFQANNLKAEQAAAAAERQAVATLRLAQLYPGMSIETARQLQQLQLQLGVITARTGAEREAAQYALDYANAMKMVGDAEQAAAIASQQRVNNIAQLNAEADRTLKNLQEQGALLRAASEEERGRIKAAQEYNRLIEQNVDAQKAGAIAAQMQANARAEQDAREMANAERDAARSANERARYTEQAAREAEREAVAFERIRQSNVAILEAAKFIPFAFRDATDAVTGLSRAMGELFNGKQGLTQFNPEGYKFTIDTYEKMFAEQLYGKGGVDLKTMQPNAAGYENKFNQQIARGDFTGAVRDLLQTGLMTAGAMGTPAQLDTAKIGVLNRAIDLLPQDQQIMATQMEINALRQTPETLARNEMINQLTESLKNLTDATKENTAATAAMTDVLSPFYTSDPRRTHLGFRAFAGGGIMTPYGELPLRNFATGGVAYGPTASIIAERGVAEAYIPVPSGRVEAVVKMPANSNEKMQRPITVNVTMTANVTRDEARKTGFMIAQEMKRSLG